MTTQEHLEQFIKYLALAIDIGDHNLRGCIGQADLKTMAAILGRADRKAQKLDAPAVELLLKSLEV